MEHDVGISRLVIQSVDTKSNKKNEVVFVFSILRKFSVL